jgi:1,2-diacylglycerol 3-beta-glucosyltransferase
MQMTEVLFRTLLLSAEVLLAAPLLYLLLLSLAALVAANRGRGARPASASPATSPHFALLVPAHDEEAVIGDLLESLDALDYPVARRDIYVIADNCTDETAALVSATRLPGVHVCERLAARQRGKGHALRWMLEELDRAGRRYDAYVVVDADSQLSPNFLRAAADALARGAAAVQGQYRVSNEAGAWTAGLRAVAFALFNHLRPLGRSALGWSAGLKGNGMCFSREVIERFGWGSYTLAEDAEYHLALVGAGVRVAYVPEAVVTSAMPTDLRQARSQQQRWERGRLVLARAYAAKLVRASIRRRDLASLDAIAEVCLPPISLLAGVLVPVLAAAIFLRWTPGLVVVGLLLLAFLLHGAAGMALARLSPRAYLSLLYAPWYIVWKIGIYAGSALRRGDGPWVRTSRAPALGPGGPTRA